MPFFSEVTWRNLAAPLAGAAESVHLATYPDADAASVDRELLEEMATTREAVVDVYEGAVSGTGMVSGIVSAVRILFVTGVVNGTATSGSDAGFYIETQGRVERATRVESEDLIASETSGC